MNICILTSSFPSHRDDHLHAPFLLDFIEGLKRKNHRVFVFTQDRLGLKEEFLNGVRTEWFSWLKSEKPLIHLRPWNPFDLLRIANLFWGGRRAVIPWVRKNKVDVCLALWVLPSGYFANYVYRKIGIPYSVWALGSDIYRYSRNPLVRPLLKRIIGEARGVFADGFDLSKKVEERLGRRCDFLATTRRLEAFERFEKVEKPNRIYQFLFVGRLEKIKGIDLLLRAVKLLREDEDLHFHLTIVGSGAMEGWVKTFARRERIEGKITFAGVLSDSMLMSLYQTSDCVVIPSRSESIPLVFTEALNFSRELIVTDVGDMGMLSRKYEVADVVPPGDPFALKEALKKKVLSQKDKSKKERRGNREELLKLFDIETSVERFLEDYKEGNRER